MKIDSLDLSSFLDAQTLFPKMYLRCRKTGKEKALLGALKQFDQIDKIPKDDQTYYGAISFHKEKSWNGFPPSFFFLPHVEIEQTPEATTIKFHGPTIALENPTTLPEIIFPSNGSHLPNYEVWEQNIKNAVAEMEKGSLQKVVFARKTSFSNKNPPFAWLKHLIKTQSNTTIFALQTDPSALFVGSSPELLFERVGNHLMAESIAGTRKRGSSAKEDLLFATALKESQKDQKEFLFVKEFLQASFASLCNETFIKKEDSFMQTSTLWHLYNKVEGILKPEVSDKQIFSLLHPTPAVCGVPTHKAQKMIENNEPFERGLYAGAIGSISQKSSTFSVSIRSSLITNDALHAFAGAGIVEASDPLLEWAELNHKISHWCL